MSTKDEKKPIEVTDDMLKKLESGEMNFGDLDEATLAAVDAKLADLENMPEDGEEPTTPADPDDPPAPPATEDKTPADPVAPQPSEDEETLRLAREQRREVEALKPRADAGAEPAKTPSKDEVWTDEHQVGLAQKFEALQKKFDDYVASHSKGLTERESKAKEMEDEADFRILQNQFPEFKSAEKLSAMEKRYASFFYGVGATAENPAPVQKYFADPAFKAECEAKGLKFDKAEFDKVNSLLRLRAQRDTLQKADPEATLADAHLVNLRRSGKLQGLLAQERNKGATELADQIHANMNGVQKPPVSGGQSHNAMNGFQSEEQMLSWLDKHPNPRTKDEKETFRRIEEYLDKHAPA
jgi:hypothetical protein